MQLDEGCRRKLGPTAPLHLMGNRIGGERFAVFPLESGNHRPVTVGDRGLHGAILVALCVDDQGTAAGAMGGVTRISVRAGPAANETKRSRFILARPSA